MCQIVRGCLPKMNILTHPTKIPLPFLAEGGKLNILVAECQPHVPLPLLEYKDPVFVLAAMWLVAVGCKSNKSSLLLNGISFRLSDWVSDINCTEAS